MVARLRNTHNWTVVRFSHTNTMPTKEQYKLLSAQPNTTLSSLKDKRVVALRKHPECESDINTAYSVLVSRIKGNKPPAPLVDSAYKRLGVNQDTPLSEVKLKHRKLCEDFSHDKADLDNAYSVIVSSK